MVHGCSAKLGTVLCENGNGVTLKPLFLVGGQFFVETGKTGSKLGTDAELALELLQWKRGNVVLSRVSGAFFTLVNLTLHFQEGTYLEIKFQQFGLTRCLYKSDILYNNFPRSISDESHSPLAPCHWGTF